MREEGLSLNPDLVQAVTSSKIFDHTGPLRRNRSGSTLKVGVFPAGLA